MAIAAGGAALAALAEIAARRLQLSDYPLFVSSKTVGYHFRPGTSGAMGGTMGGAMGRRHRWRINAMGLRTDSDAAPGADSIVLLGDSTVEDGAYTDQDETLAARLARATGRDVHPVACPAWSLENQLAFLRANPALYEAGTMVFVTNTQDLAALNQWETESAQPTRRPRSHAWYKVMRATHLARRKAFPLLFPPWADEADRNWERSVRALLARYEGRLIWLFYPLPAELAHGKQPCTDLRPPIAGRAETRELAAAPGWSLGCYADEVHPNARGRELLLGAILSALNSRPAD